MTPDSTRDIDAAIDAAARGLTALEPSRRTAVQVATRIAARPRRDWRTPVWIAASAAAAIAIIVSVAHQPAAPPAGRSLAGGATTASPSTRVASSATDAARATPASPATAAPPSTRRPAPAPRPNPPTSTFDAVGAAWRARTIPALSQPAALVVETSQPDPLSMPLLELKPIAAAPLELPALAYGTSQR